MALSKFHNKRSGGFDSNKEKNRYYELLMMQRAGLITGLQRQVKFELIPAHYEHGKCTERACSYYADFTYWEQGKFVVEDCKGFRTDVYKIKKKLMLQRGYKIRET